MVDKETEEKVIELLVAGGPSPSKDDAIHAVDKAMGWVTTDTWTFVEDLMNRGLVILSVQPHDLGADTEELVWWERP